MVAGNIKQEKKPSPAHFSYVCVCWFFLTLNLLAVPDAIYGQDRPMEFHSKSDSDVLAGCSKWVLVTRSRSFILPPKLYSVSCFVQLIVIPDVITYVCFFNKTDISDELAILRISYPSVCACAETAVSVDRICQKKSFLFLFFRWTTLPHMFNLNSMYNPTLNLSFPPFDWSEIFN